MPGSGSGQTGNALATTPSFEIQPAGSLRNRLACGVSSRYTTMNTRRRFCGMPYSAALIIRHSAE